MARSATVSKPAMPPSVLILACGNPSRGDDALGSLFLERLAATQERFGWNDVELITDFQFQIEHVVDLEDRALVLFVDSSVSCLPPYQFIRLQPAFCDTSYTSHALSPATVLQVYTQVHHTPPPSAFQLAIRGERFELGESLSAAAEANLAAALEFTERLLMQRDAVEWM